jgi:hypothetical protein
MHVRLAPAGVTCRFGLALFVCCVFAACGRGGGDAIKAEWSVEPASPATGADTTARITLRNAARQPVRGARLRLEGHMSHPGMTAVVADVTERGDGVYDARLQFTMAGDWILVLIGELPDGTRIVEQLEVTGVRPAG